MLFSRKQSMVTKFLYSIQYKNEKTTAPVQ